jgi:alkylhydroperoxidase/carboxymuconolactone decarboxylase family protein YurZ
LSLVPASLPGIQWTGFGSCLVDLAEEDTNGHQGLAGMYYVENALEEKTRQLVALAAMVVAACYT